MGMDDSPVWTLQVRKKRAHGNVVVVAVSTIEARLKGSQGTKTPTVDTCSQVSNVSFGYHNSAKWPG